MKSYLKVAAIIALAVALPAQAAIMNFSLDKMIVAQPVTIANTGSSTDSKTVTLANTTLELKPLETFQQEFQTFDPKLMNTYELQIFNNLQTQLEFALQPKNFNIDENEFDKTLVQYRGDRVAQINRENAGNIAEVNDQIGVLDNEIDEFSLTLRLQLQDQAVLMEKEQEQLVLNLQASLADFKTFYLVKKEEGTLHSGSLSESPVVKEMETKIEESSDTYKQVEEKQDSVLTAISVAKEDTSDDSLKALYLKEVELQIQKDSDVLPVMLNDLQDQREKIVTLSDDIKLLSAPIVVSDKATDDQLVQSEQTALLEAKEVELQEELNVYYQMQTETQVVLNTSLATFATFQLK